MQRHDVLVHLLEVVDRVAAGGGEVADIEVDANVLRTAVHGLLEAGGQVEFPGFHIVVAVHAHEHFRLGGEGIDALGAGYRGRRREARDAESVRHLEAALDLGVGEIVAEAVVVSVEQDAGVVELLADVFEHVHGCGCAPVTQRGAAAGCLRLDMALPQLAFTQADLYHSLDGLIEGSVAEAVALRAELHAVDLGIGLGDRQGGGKRRERQPVKISSRKHMRSVQQNGCRISDFRFRRCC